MTQALHDIKLGTMGSHSGRLLGPSKLRMNSVCEQRPDSPPCFDPRMEASAPPTPTHLQLPLASQELYSGPMSLGPASTDSQAPTPANPTQQLAFGASDALTQGQLSARHSHLSGDWSHDALNPQQYRAGLGSQEDDAMVQPPPVFGRRSANQPPSPSAHQGSQFASNSQDRPGTGALHTFAAAPAAPLVPTLDSKPPYHASGTRLRRGSAPSPAVPMPPPPLQPPQATQQQLQSMYMAMAAGAMPAPLAAAYRPAGSMPMASAAVAAVGGPAALAGAMGYAPFPTAPAMPHMAPPSYPFGPSLGPMGVAGAGGAGGGFMPPFDTTPMSMAPMAAMGAGPPSLHAGMAVPPPMFPGAHVPALAHPFAGPGSHPGLPNPAEYAEYYKKYMEAQVGMLPGSSGVPGGAAAPTGFHGGGRRPSGGRGGGMAWDMGPGSRMGVVGNMPHVGGRGPPGPYSRDSGGGGHKGSAFEHVQHARAPVGKGGGGPDGAHHGRGGGGGGVNANGVALNHGGGGGGKKGGRKDESGMPNHGQPLTLLEEFKANKAYK